MKNIFLSDFVNFALRLTGYLLIIFNFFLLPKYFISYYFSTGIPLVGFALNILFSQIIPIIFGIFLIQKNKRITDLLLIKNLEKKEVSQIGNIEGILIRILALYLLFKVVSDAIYHSSMYFYSHYTEEQAYFTLESQGEVMATLAEFVFVVILFYVSKKEKNTK